MKYFNVYLVIHRHRRSSVVQPELSLSGGFPLWGFSELIWAALLESHGRTRSLLIVAANLMFLFYLILCCYCLGG